MNSRIIGAVLLLALLLAASAQVPSADDPVRVFADSMAQAFVEKQDSVLIDNFSPAMIETYGKETMVAPLQAIRARYGDAISYQFKQANAGELLAGIRKLRSVTVWYVLKTSKRESGTFLQITVTREGQKYVLARYFVSELLGGKTPSALQGWREPSGKMKHQG